MKIEDISESELKAVDDKYKHVLEQYTAILEWLYENDAAYPDKLAWRKAFLSKLVEALWK